MKAIGCLRRCGKMAASRGLCHKHHAEAHRHIRARRTTWVKLIRLGMALPSRMNLRTYWNEGRP